MGSKINTAERVASGDYDLELVADVLVIGGSIAGQWAAVAAVQEGASVILVDKGYAGASGPAAAGSVGAYYIKPDDPIQRDAMVNARMPLAFGLADSRWGERILDQSYRNLDTMAKWGYQWPKIHDGRERRGTITPNFLAFLRQQVERLGVRILDHSPALELLTSDGVAAGAAGVRRRTGETWAVRAGAVVIATGGTAFKSVTAGTGGNTGDGYLLAGEAGAELSGMEFSGQFHVRHYEGTLTKGAYRGGDNGGWAQLTDNNGNQVNLGRQTVKAILETGAAWDSFEKVQDAELQELIVKAAYGTTQVFDDLGQNPFKEKYRVDFICEGTIRATGGIAIGDDLQTNVPGLFASGDVASREKVNGAGPPGGGPAAGWALGAGFFSGQYAAQFAQKIGKAAATRKVRAVGGAALRPTGAKRKDIDLAHVEERVKGHMHSLDRNYYRNGETLQASLDEYAGLWKQLREGLVAADGADARDSARNVLRARETAALLQAARWVNASALERKETRGLHRRTDFPDLDLKQTHHLITGGIDDVWVKKKNADPTAIFPDKERFFPLEEAA